MDSAGEPLLEVSDLRVRIERDTGVVRPLNGVSFRIHQGQSVGIVGESGCGKTMASNALLRILPRRAQITAGTMWFRNKAGDRVDLAQLGADAGAQPVSHRRRRARVRSRRQRAGADPQSAAGFCSATWVSPWYSSPTT